MSVHAPARVSSIRNGVSLGLGFEAYESCALQPWRQWPTECSKQAILHAGMPGSTTHSLCAAMPGPLH